MKPDVGIQDKDRSGVAKILNRLLADEYVLYTKTRNYHWNVVGLQFGPLHKFFEAQYEELNDIVDAVAERARALGEWSSGTLAEFLKDSRLKERPGEHTDSRGMVSSLLSDHESIIRTLRADAGTCADKHHDMGTNDFMIGLLEHHEKMAWMLRASLEGKSD
jgi:starvation-inducible DNA-binding protein